MTLAPFRVRALQRTAITKNKKMRLSIEGRAWLAFPRWNITFENTVIKHWKTKKSKLLSRTLYQSYQIVLIWKKSTKLYRNPFSSKIYNPPLWELSIKKLSPYSHKKRQWLIIVLLQRDFLFFFFKPLVGLISWYFKICFFFIKAI